MLNCMYKRVKVKFYVCVYEIDEGELFFFDNFVWCLLFVYGVRGL